MYRVDRNNFYREQKNNTIYTPEKVSWFIYNILEGRIDKSRPVFDPCAGAGSLLKPFRKNGYRVIGIDIEKQGFPRTIIRNYLEIEREEVSLPSLILMNPPFNIDAKTRKYITRYYGGRGRPLLPEVWLQKAIELFGRSIPMVLFTPYGLRLNQTEESNRWQRFINGQYPEISSIISLPKNIFKDVLFHSEILVFNIENLKGHYFYNGQ